MDCKRKYTFSIINAKINDKGRKLYNGELSVWLTREKKVVGDTVGNRL